jgi:hypothetical protein
LSYNDDAALEKGSYWHEDTLQCVRTLLKDPQWFGSSVERQNSLREETDDEQGKAGAGRKQSTSRMLELFHFDYAALEKD